MITFKIGEELAELTISEEEKPKLQAQADKDVSYRDVALGMVVLLALRSMGLKGRKELLKSLSEAYKRDGAGI